MFRLVDIFKYPAKDTYLSHIDPRAKIIICILYVIPVVLFSGIYELMIIYSLVLVNLALGKSVARYLRSLIYLSPFLALVAFLNYITMGSLIDALIPILRLIILIAILDIFFFTTDPDNFILTLESLNLPLSISLSFALALRFIPTMLIQINEIVEAQISRGLQLDRGNFLKRIRNYIPIIVPLVILSIKRSIEVAESLEVRGVHPNAPRTRYVELRFTSRDYIYLMINIAVVASISIAMYIYPINQLLHNLLPINF